MKKPKFI